jgi:hypothetical protein
VITGIGCAKRETPSLINKERQKERSSSLEKRRIRQTQYEEKRDKLL